MDIVKALNALKQHSVLRYMTLDGVMSFTRLVGALKRDILQPQPIEESNPDVAPAGLPRPIARFLSTSLGIPFGVIDNCWEILGDQAWEASTTPLTTEDFRLFKEFGWENGIISAALSVYPLEDCCTNKACPDYLRIPLKKEYHRKIVVYTQAHGVQPAYHVHLYCPKCKTSYHNNYAVQGGTRYYRDGVPEFIQVGEHQYVETKLIYGWRANMLFGWFSATNISRVYDYAVTDHNYTAPSEWGLDCKLTTEHVWDGFVTLGLIEDAIFRMQTLQVPHSGAQADRFKVAMEARNTWIVLNGQPDAVRHACNLCMRVFAMPDGTYRKTQGIVGDGLSMGRPCCGVFRCLEPLENNRHRFCAGHQSLENECAVVGCNNPVVEPPSSQATGTKTIKKKTCALLLHQQIESKHHERSTGAFLFKQRLQHAQISQPVDAFGSDQRVPEQDVQEDIESYTVDGGAIQLNVEKNAGSVGVLDQPEPEVAEPCPSKSTSGNRLKPLKAQFGRRRTHNEQTLVRPCGIIFARATMYGAEAVSNFLVMVKNAFSVPGAQKPEHIFYDTNCDVRQQAEKDSWFKGVGMCVDVWHFKNKHAVTHEYCQTNCNPAIYPELMDEHGGWFFNTSVAEQTNAWLGGYHSIVREMLPAKYEFFLDEMIRLRNIEVLKRLNRTGQYPRNL